MKLNYNSISARIYRWFYHVDSMPSTLCPYFWKLLLMWILILPFSLLILPYYMFNHDRVPNKGERLFFGVLYYIGFGIIFSMVASLLTFITPMQFSSSIKTLIDVGNCIWIFLIFSCSLNILSYIKDKIFHKKTEGVQRSFGSSLFIEFIKSIYSKSCPRIDWIRK